MGIKTEIVAEAVLNSLLLMLCNKFGKAEIEMLWLPHIKI